MTMSANNLLFISITLSMLQLANAAFEANAYIDLLEKVVNYTHVKSCWVCGSIERFNAPLLGIPLGNWMDFNPYSLLNASYQCKQNNVTMESISFIWDLLNTSIPYINYSTNGINLGVINMSLGNWSAIKLKIDHSSDPNHPGNYTSGIGTQQWADYLWGRATTNTMLAINVTCNLPDGYWWLCGDQKARKQLPGNWMGHYTMGILAPPFTLHNHISFNSIVRGIWGLSHKKRSVANPLSTYNTGFHSLVRGLLPTLGVVQLEKAIANITGEMEIIANRTAEALFGLQTEIRSLKTLVLQNRRALDILTAQAGGVCTMLNESCCSLTTLAEELTENSRIDSSVTGWLESWFGKWRGMVISIFTSLIVVAGVLIAIRCCIIPYIGRLVQSLIETTLSKQILMGPPRYSDKML
uniref:Envelope glycoprotein n=1 Tax=Strigops habroptila TaxID=2489341 RepID=A0A672TI87_STRHB